MVGEQEHLGTFANWTELLHQARFALAHPRTEELEELAARAECMLAETIGSDPIRQRLPGLDPAGISHIHREHDLMRDLLEMSLVNLKILRRKAGPAHGDGGGGGMQRWVL